MRTGDVGLIFGKTLVEITFRSAGTPGTLPTPSRGTKVHRLNAASESGLFLKSTSAARQRSFSSEGPS